MINARDMHKLANEYKPTDKCPIAERIRQHIEQRARGGHYYAEFIDEEKIEYIKLHKSEYRTYGFCLSFDSDYDFPVAMISW